MTAVIADRQGLVRDILTAACTRSRITVVGEATTGSELVALCNWEHPDVVLSGADLGEGRIEDQLDAVFERCHNVFILGGTAPPARVAALLDRSACGYLLYDNSPEEIIAALRAAVSCRPVSDD